MRRVCYSVLLLSSLTFSSVFTSCNKKKDAVVEPEPVEETKNVKQSDQTGSSAADGAMDDVNDYINNSIGGGSSKRTGESSSARLEAYNLPCGVVSIDSSTSASGKKLYTIKYGDKTKCGYKKKSGDVTFQLVKGANFGEVGAEFKVTFINYVVEVLATNDIVKINGFITSTNVSGGYVWQSVLNNATIKHKIRGTYNITYANGETRVRNYFQLRTWTSTNSWAGLTFTVAGDTTINAKSVSETGKTLDGNHYFETQIIEPYKWINSKSTFAGPYVLSVGHARMDVTTTPVAITPAYFDVEAGYYYDSNNPSSTPVKVNDGTANAYKIQIMVGPTNSTQYQLY